MAPVVQKSAPLFSAEAVDKESFKTISLEDYRGKYVVLMFYPLDFTFVCPTELCSFSDRIDEFRALNCEVLGVSIDSKFCHLAYNQLARNKGGLGVLNYPLIADVTKSISKDYGVLIEEGPDAGVALRGLFIISDQGIIRSSIINDLPVGRSCDEILRLVQAFQFTDKHGEVCPANWKPGKPTMKADIASEQTKKYWENTHSSTNGGSA